MIGGLKPTPPDERDYALGAITFLPTEIPEAFFIPFTVKNQGDTDFCSAYMSCAMSEPQEKVELNPEYSFALSKLISGDPDAWGQNLRTALQAHRKYGAIEQTVFPFDGKPSEFLRDISNWPDLTKEAYPHRKQSFFKITGQFDHFDNAKASIFKFKSPIGTGVNFGWPLTQVVLDTIPKGGFGHAVAIVGYEKDYLWLLNSYGETAGDRGIHKITREVYNHFAEQYGHYMFVDISPEEAKHKLENGILIDDNWLIAFIKTIITALKNIFKI